MFKHRKQTENKLKNLTFWNNTEAADPQDAFRGRFLEARDTWAQGKGLRGLGAGEGASQAGRAAHPGTQLLQPRGTAGCARLREGANCDSGKQYRRDTRNQKASREIKTAARARGGLA